MKKMFLYASMLGLVAGAIYYVCRKEKTNSTAPMNDDRHISNKEKTVYESKEDGAQLSENIDKMHQTKNESVQNVSDRHFEAGKIMQSVYQNIMEDFVEDLSDVKKADISEKPIIDSEEATIMEELESISDDLDELLK